MASPLAFLTGFPSDRELQFYIPRCLRFLSGTHASFVQQGIVGKAEPHLAWRTGFIAQQPNPAHANG